MIRIKAYIPNTITLLNLVCGVIACILAFRYDENIGPFTAYQWAFLSIGAAALFDFMDGAMARLLHAYSDIGKELDSLADLISFGMAPAMLVYNTVCYFSPGFSPWALISLFIVAMGALRLARFNVDTRQTTSFIGLPIPANAIFWIGFVAWINTHVYPGDWVMAIMMIGVSLLMVCNLRMFSLKFSNFSWRSNYRRYLLLISAALLVLFAGIPGFAWTILLYVLMSLVRKPETV